MRPGSYVVRRQDQGAKLGSWLCKRLNLRMNVVAELFARKAITVDGKIPSSLNVPMSANQIVCIGIGKKTQKQEPKINKNTSKQDLPWNPKVIFMDADILVVEKPSGITTVHHFSDQKRSSERDRKYLPPTLQDILPDVVKTTTGKNVPYIRAVHRLDKDTSGLMLFAMSSKALSALGKKMRNGEIERRYLAITRGVPKEGIIESSFVQDRGDGRRGSGKAQDAEHAITRVKILDSMGDIALVECELETGRTHQVRIHLGEAGAPLCGERIYDRPLHGRPLPDPTGIDRVALHSCFLKFEHPISNKEMSWSSKLPKDMQAIIDIAKKKNSGD